MSVSQAEIIDYIGISKSDGTVALVVADDLDWSNESHHLRALQDKVNSYLSFIEGGQLISQFPDTKGRSVRIHIAFRFMPTSTALSFLESVRSIVESTGVAFSHRTCDPSASSETPIG